MLHKYSFGYFFLVGVLLCGQALSAERSVAFPGAVGFGINTTAGNNGQVIKVTNLDNFGPGSLRAALASEGPRVIIFEVGGVIDLEKKDIIITEPFLTIAGQTAPSPGITIIRGQFGIGTHDVVIRHIRVRPGDANLLKPRYWQPDGITAHGAQAYNIVIDHCSITWAVDENVSVSGAGMAGPEATARRITFSNCIIAEGLNKSTHAKGEHSEGAHVNDFSRKVAFIGNLFAQNNARSPYFKAQTTGVIVNNVIYNPGQIAIELWYHESEWEGAKYRPANCRVSIVGNVYIQGADTGKDVPFVALLGDVYAKDNLAFDRQGRAIKPVIYSTVVVPKEDAIWPADLVSIPADKVVEYVARHAGARPKDRDKTDKRIIRNLRERKGRIIDSQEDVGGYPKEELTRRPLDVPQDKLEEWLESFAKKIE